MPILEISPELMGQLHSVFSTPVSAANPDITWGVMITFIIALYAISRILGGEKK